jgi:hypothetical protein
MVLLGERAEIIGRARDRLGGFIGLLPSRSPKRGHGLAKHDEIRMLLPCGFGDERGILGAVLARRFALGL